MENSSIYRQMAFKVHPDVSNVINATEMMKEVNANKNNPVELIKLAAKWGLNIQIPNEYKDIFEKARNNKNNFSFNHKESRKVYEAVVNAVVEWSYKYKFKSHIGYGIISKVRKIKKGKFAGYTEWTVMDLISGSEKKIKSINSPFIVKKIASSEMIEHAKNLINEDKRRKKVKKSEKKLRYEKYFNELGLKPNKTYNNHKIKVSYKTGSRWEKLIRTTNFYVYYDYCGRKRRIDLKFVVDSIES